MHGQAAVQQLTSVNALEDTLYNAGGGCADRQSRVQYLTERQTTVARASLH